MKVKNTNGTEVFFSGQGLKDTVLAKFTPNGNVLWATQITGAMYTITNSITVDPFDNVIVGGSSIARAISFYSADSNQADKILTRSTQFDDAGFLAKYSGTLFSP